MPKVRVGDLEMYYELRGRGEALAMIMGLGGNADWWDPETLEALSRDFQVLVFDNRDAGRTTGPPGNPAYTIKDMAGDTAGLLERLGIGRANVLGLSMGGMIAQELALAYPDKVARLVLGCTTPGLSRGAPPTPKAMAVMTGLLKGGSVIRMGFGLLRVLFTPWWVVRNVFRLGSLFGRLSAHVIKPDAYQRQIQAISVFDTADRLGGIRCPTLVLHGDRDILLPPENGRILARLIPGAELFVFRGCAHGFNAEKPKLFVKVVREFLTGGS